MFDRGLTAAAIFAGFIVRGVGFAPLVYGGRRTGVCLSTAIGMFVDCGRVFFVLMLYYALCDESEFGKSDLDLRPFNATLSYVHGRGVWGSVLRVTRETGVMGSVPSAPSR